MKLLADENLHLDIIQGLRKAKFEVILVPDIDLTGHKDREILEYAEKNDLLVISGDKDFGGLIEFGILWGEGKGYVAPLPNPEYRTDCKEYCPSASPGRRTP